MSKQYIIPIFVPHLGCPNDCIFCNQKSISGQMKQITEEEVEKTIEEFLNSFKEENLYTEIAFFGGSFTGIDIELQEKLLKVAYKYVQNKQVDGIRISTRPDYIDKEKLSFFEKNELDEMGSKVIQKGEYAVITMAGGQGTRLDHQGPKGTFKIDVEPKPKYLFE